MIDRLINYYGGLGDEEQRFIRENVLKLDESVQNSFATALMSANPASGKKPDVAAISKAYKVVTGKSPRTYAWAICDDCKAEYDYRFERCPKCHLAGKRSSGYKVKKSDFPPPMKVIRWNQTTLRDDGKAQYCVSCPERDHGFCRWFGDPAHTCPPGDYEYCECKRCCAIHKKGNARLLNV